jgi:hypothetical protein
MFYSVNSFDSWVLRCRGTFFVRTAAMNVSHAILGGLSVLAMLVDNTLWKVRRNFFIGVRRSWPANKSATKRAVWRPKQRLQPPSLR